MEQKQLDLLDKMNYAACANFFTFGKDTKRIELIHFDSKNIEHRGLLLAASIARYYFNYTLYIDASRKEIRELNKEFSFKAKKLYKKRNDCPDCDGLINYISTALNATKMGVGFGDNL